MDKRTPWSPQLTLAAWLALPALLGACRPAAPELGADSLVVPLPGGEELRLAGPAQRVLPTNASALDYVLALVGEERLAAIPATAEAYANAGELSPELPRFPVYTAESALAHDPDLVVTHAWQKGETSQLLSTYGVPVLIVPDLHELEDVHETLRTLGLALGRSERAAEVRAQIDERVARLAADSSRAGVSAMTYTNYGTGGFTAGTSTSADLMLRLAGLQNAAAIAELESNAPLPHEMLLSIDPDLIVVSSAAEESDLAPTVRLLRGEELLSGLRALAGQRVIQMPARLYSASSLHVVEAAEELARLADQALAGED